MILWFYTVQINTTWFKMSVLCVFFRWRTGVCARVGDCTDTSRSGGGGGVGVGVAYIEEAQ